MPTMESLEDLLQDELKDIYDAEKQLTKALPKLAKKASNHQLRQAIEQHLQETAGHVERVEQAFAVLGIAAKSKRCEGMKHLLDEGRDMIGDADEDAVRDAVMIAAAQKVEHYEIASYGTLRTWANLLGKKEAAAIFEEILEEEKAADATLTEIAERTVNAEAAGREGARNDEVGEEEDRPASRGRVAARRSTRQIAADRGRRSSSVSRGRK